jgi:hsp70-interacting protein
MESLLRWGIENSAPSDGTVNRPQQPLDPGIIDVILGKPDSVLMKEDLEVAVDQNRAVDERVDALEDFETVSTIGRSSMVRAYMANLCVADSES